MNYLKNFITIDKIVTALENNEDVLFYGKKVTDVELHENRFTYGDNTVCYFVNCTKEEFIFPRVSLLTRIKQYIKFKG